MSSCGTRTSLAGAFLLASLFAMGPLPASAQDATSPANDASMQAVENGWDFNAANGVPGFGPMRDDTNMDLLLRQATGQDRGAPAPTEQALEGPRPDQLVSLK